MFSAVRGRGGVRACDPASANRAIIAGNWQTANGRGNMRGNLKRSGLARRQPPAHAMTFAAFPLTGRDRIVIEYT